MQMFLYSEQINQRVIMLWTVPQHPPRLCEVPTQLLAKDLHRPLALCSLSQRLERGGLASAVDSEQREALPKVETEGRPLYSHHRLSKQRGVHLAEGLHFDRHHLQRVGHSLLFSEHVLVQIQVLLGRDPILRE